MHWLDTAETYEQKLKRIEDEMNKHPDDRIVIVGESAGGAMALAALERFKDRIDHVITVCGMNQGSGNVSPYLYKRNPAFHDTMVAADRTVKNLSEEQKIKLFIIYSSTDFTVRPKNTLIPGVEAFDLNMFSHAGAILYVLFWRYRIILRRIFA